MKATHRISVLFDAVTDRMYGPHKCKCDCDGEWACGACWNCGEPVPCVYAPEIAGQESRFAGALTARRQQLLADPPSALRRIESGFLRGLEGFLRRLDRPQPRERPDGNR